MKMFRVIPLLMLLLGAVFPAAAEERARVPTAGSPSCGPENAPVTVVEFIDYT